MVNFVPLGERVIVQPIEFEQQTKGGIFLPDTAKEKPQEGKVVAVGPGRVGDDGARIPMELASGDRSFTPNSPEPSTKTVTTNT